MASKYKESYVTFGQVWPCDPKQTKNGSHARSTTTTTTINAAVDGSDNNDGDGHDHDHAMDMG